MYSASLNRHSQPLFHILSVLQKRWKEDERETKKGGISALKKPFFA